MQVERFDATDRAKWLAMRKQDVTASAAGALLEVHDWATYYSLWALKTGRIKEDPEETKPMQRGRLLEPVAVALLREQYPKWDIKQPGVYLRDPSIRLGATPDCIAITENGEPINIQIKSVEGSIFAKKWRREDRSIDVPVWIAIQSIIEAHLQGFNRTAVAPLVVGFGLECPLVEIPMHDGVIETIRQAVPEFWAKVASGEDVDPDYTKDGAIISKMWASDNGKEIDLSHDNHLPVILDELDKLKDDAKANTERQEEIKAEFKHKLGENTFARLAGGRWASLKTTNKGEYMVKPSSFRTLRFSDKRPK